MSRLTIRATNLLFDVLNLNSALANATPGEIARWTPDRDRKLARLRKAIASFTPADWAHLEKWPNTLKELKNHE